MTDEQLAYEIALGLIKSGVEGPYNAVSCSTAGDYPSMGVSQWEGSRGDYLLSWLDGGLKFIGRSYSDIAESGQLEELANLLESEQGQSAQNQILANDCLQTYLPSLSMLTNPLCIIYAGIWCPTSHRVVSIFINNRLKWGYDVNDLNVLYKLFFDQYYIAADVGEDYKRGYQNRAINTFNYVDSLDLSQYG
jgi:hypothetical protein